MRFTAPAPMVTILRTAQALPDRGARDSPPTCTACQPAAAAAAFVSEPLSDAARRGGRYARILIIASFGTSRAYEVAGAASRAERAPFNQLWPGRAGPDCEGRRQWLPERISIRGCSLRTLLELLVSLRFNLATGACSASVASFSGLASVRERLNTGSVSMMSSASGQGGIEKRRVGTRERTIR